MTEFTPNTALINKQLADRSHSGTSWDPETRARQEIVEFGEIVQSVYDDLKPYAKSEAQQAKLQEEIQRFQAGLAEKYNAKLAAHGNCISSFIAGPSGFPSRRAEKANNSYERRYEEMIEFKHRAKAAIIRELKKLATEEAGGELEVLKQKIESAERTQEEMKKANAILRSSATNEEKVKQLVEMGFSSGQAYQLLIPDFAGRVGYSFHLQNNNANIRRMKERLAEMQKKEATPTSDIAFMGGRIVDNAELDRVQIIHDEKPAQAVIDKLKSEGWRFSSHFRCWQRKRTPQALYDAKRVTGAV